MFLPLSETRLECGDGIVRLLDRRGAALLELRGESLERALLIGHIDRDFSHASVYRYARMQCDLASFASAPARDYDRRFLGGLGLRWD